MPRFAQVWIIGTILLSVLAYPIAVWRGDDNTATAMVAGVVVSLITLLTCVIMVWVGTSRRDPLTRMLVETTVRFVIPLSFLLAILFVRQDLLTDVFLLYFIPYQLLTIVATTADSIASVSSRPINTSVNES